MDKLSGMVKSGKRDAGIPYISDYPPAPSQLPQSFKSLYGDDMPPEVMIPELDHILGTAKMRGRPTNSPDWLKHVPFEYQQVVLQELKDPW